MNMAKAILKCKSSVDINREIRKNPKYREADKEFRKLVYKKHSKEKAKNLDKLRGILIEAVIKAYFSEGERLGEKIGASLLID